MNMKACAYKHDECPFWERHVTLGRTYKGSLDYAQNRGEKDLLLAQAISDMKDGAVFFVAWTGKWRTDLFAVTQADLPGILATR